MKTNSLQNLLVGFVAMLGAASVAHADPLLQLDIAKGTYDTVSQTTVSAGSKFTLYALQSPGKQGDNPKPMLTEQFYLSMALTPSSNISGNFGSFNYFIDSNANGLRDGSEALHTINATSGMSYGTPPLEANLMADGGDLASHDTFPAYFAEQGFWFNSSLETKSYDVQTSANAHKTLTNFVGGGLYYMPFVFDLSGLDDTKSIHFDLYSEELITNTTRTRVGRNWVTTTTTDTDVKKFAPFSHDAESGHQVPEGGATAIMLGLGMLGLGLARRFLN